MERLPSLFISHGAPTYALEPGAAGARLAALGCLLPRPQGVLVVSPHWMTAEPQVTMSLHPRTIHDFGGFDPALYDITYPVEGAPRLARRALDMLREAGWPAAPDTDRGLDHGAWVPLLHLYPAGDVPAFQVSLPTHFDPHAAYDFGRALEPLADEGVLIVGSGSLTHNLSEFQMAPTDAHAYVLEFAHWIRDAVLAGDHARLREALSIAPHAARAHPTAEHYLPLLVAAGAAGQALPASVIEGGIRHGVLSMDSFVFGCDIGTKAALHDTDAIDAVPNLINDSRKQVK
ncbi:MAG TPA: class III extradiol ring-cleavage dioxygenase [Rhodocyclaceae bacterium]|nr:class III extradiol ring-cleavage dioxygenase [Rhodocyclaceae bacterium]HRQ46013.1 class III extradiol ring-cleavage dioxygenase [Rhodocyclaceae bacterium]